MRTITKDQVILLTVLVITGAVWGMTIPASKIVVTAGYPIVGILFWQVLIVIFVTGALLVARGSRLHFSKASVALMIWVAGFGTLVPNSIGYYSAFHLPAGVMAITIALVPIFVMPIAILIGHERLQMHRVLGVICGAIAILLLIGPEASLPDPSKSIFVLFALLAPFCYAFEDNYIAYFGTDGLDPVAVIFGAMLVAFVAITPIMLYRGDFFLLGANGGSEAELALILASSMHALAYGAFVWLIGKGGPVFSSLVAYLVTGFGVIWSMLYLKESYSAWIWAAFLLMMGAVYLIRPRQKA